MAAPPPPAPPPRAPGGPDTLRRLLADLCTRGPPKDGASALFARHIEEEARDLGGEAFGRFTDYLYHRINTLSESSEVTDNLGALRAIDELIDMKLGERAGKLSRFAGYLRHIFEEKHDPEVLVVASKVLGHFALAGGATMADEVERQVKHALDWLQGERVESRRFAAVLILKEMAENAPTMFNVHVPEFVDAVWVALRDSKLQVRERAVEALRACLSVIETRETRWRVQWYYRMFEATQEGLGRNASVESIHGSLLAVGELLRNTGEFMMSRYKEVADIVFKYREHRDRLVRRSITALLPRIAHFLRDRFVTSYLKICMDHLLLVMRNPAERGSGFVALAEMAGAVGGELEPYLPVVTSLLREAIAPRRGRSSMEALACVGSLAKAMGPAMEEHVRGLLEAMFLAGLTPTLVEALENIVASLPSLLSTVQERLLDSISQVLARSPYGVARGSGMPAPRLSLVPSSPQGSEQSGSALVQLALRTLTTFDLKGHELLEFTREAVVLYLEDEDGVTRRDAAVCCCRLMEFSFSSFGSANSRFSSNRSVRAGGGSWRRRHLIEEILEKLLVAAVADADPGVRKAVLLSLHENASFDIFLAQADSLRAIFIALNDEAFDVRELAISISGRLSEQNPAYVLPALRCHLVQLLTDLEQSPDSKNREESAQLLGRLMRSCERLVIPYIDPVHKVLLAKLQEGSGGGANNGVLTGVLATVGQLARVGGCAMRKYLGKLMPLIRDVLLDGSASVKREVAVSTLGQLIHSTGYVVAPYTDYPELLGLLLRLLNGDLAWSTRREVLKVLGIVGALDPLIQKRNQQSLQGGHGEGHHAVVPDARQQVHSMEEHSPELWPSGGLLITSEDYYSTVAIHALMRILKDPQSSYHQKVVGSLMYIFKTMGLGCVPYLPKVMPDLFLTVQSCEEGLREFIFLQLALLVSIVRQHIRKYLPEMLTLILDFWSSLLLPSTSRPGTGSPILNLVEQLCKALSDEFRIYLPKLLPRCIQFLNDAERNTNYVYVPPILHTLEVFGSNLDEHMHVLLPALIRLFRPDISDAPLEIRRATIKTLTHLLPALQVSGHVSELMHSLKQVLDGNIDELRKDAVDAICAVAVALGSDFTFFLPSVRKLIQRHLSQHAQFHKIEERLRRQEPLFLDVQTSQVVSGNVAVGDSFTAGNNGYYGVDFEDRYDDGIDPSSQIRNFKVNDGRIRAAWEASQRSTKEDWAEWMRHFSIELLKESPSPALRTCARLAQLQPFVGRELFTAGFVSCWSQLNDAYQQQLVRSLEMAFSSPNIPPEILGTLLNLAEFMEHDEKPLPIDIRLLGALAEKCHAFAKALHYKEMEFEGAQTKKMEANPVSVVEALIHINNQLHQHEAAVGILTYAQQHLSVELKESWYEKLQRWDEALEAYTSKASQTTSVHAVLGRMRCLAALARWEELNSLCRESWARAEPGARLEMAPMAANAAWNMGEWDMMGEYVHRLDDGDELKLRNLGNSSSSADGSSDGPFFRAVLCIRRGKYDEARGFVERARKCVATELAALVLESYDRAYNNMVRVQQLSELEEVIDYCTLCAANGGNEVRTALIRKMWHDRIRGTKRNVEVWHALLAVRALVLPANEDIETWLKFASLCRKSGRPRQSLATLVKLLPYDPEVASPSRRDMYLEAPQVMFAYLKYQWSLGEESIRLEAFHRLQELSLELDDRLRPPGPIEIYPVPNSNASGIGTMAIPLIARLYLKLGTWHWSLKPRLDDDSIRGILNALQSATEFSPSWAKAWHKWAFFNTAVISHHNSRGHHSAVSGYVEAAVKGYFYSIAFASSSKGGDDSLQDILRLLTLWFNYGATHEVKTALQEGFSFVNIDTWLVVLPQIIARIHSNIPAVRELIQSLLVRIGRGHPQALMYPLLVACKSISSLRKTAAEQVVEEVRQHSQHSALLVEQAQLVSKELIRVAILWHEAWHEALEEASRLYFGEHNVEGMLHVLDPLHRMLEIEGPTTIQELHFVQNYGRELQEAYDCCMKYRKTGKEAELTQAWDLYYHVFKRINKQLPGLTTLELQNVSPALLNAQDLVLAVPGTYRTGAPVVTIRGFAPQLIVISSKQRPRKCTINGSDGEDYAFLLKGHEDLRQDERVMQLFGLVNTLLANAPNTAEKDLSIQRYAVIPLSPNSGLIGWVPNCDTLHHLIREYRDARKIPVNIEHKHMLTFAPDYENLTLIGKVEVFGHALQITDGNDLAKVLWLKSRTSEVWLSRRTNYTRSLAVMSMVGYLLGLGDRHPSNLMLHRVSGKILHIDFGDCFEASMNREKFPEKVPFRLTRMLVKAMEVSGIEGNFRFTCENVLQVLRTNKDSVMAMMEAFVHDPLINWRLFNINEVPQMGSLSTIRGPANDTFGGSTELPSPPQRGVRERELLQAMVQLGDANEVLNDRAVAVMARMKKKLTGRDFSPSTLSVSSMASNADPYLADGNGLNFGDTRDIEAGHSVKVQVQKLIDQATSHENLCQSYVGWCPFW